MALPETYFWHLCTTGLSSASLSFSSLHLHQNIQPSLGSAYATWKSHCFSESLQLSIQSCSLIFLSFPVVRDNLQCIYRRENDSSGKSFCSWIERADEAHSFFFPETPQTPSSRKRPFFCYWRKLFGPPQASSRIYLLVFPAKAEELTWSRGAPLGAPTMFFKSQHTVLRKALPIEGWCQSTAQALQDHLDRAT